MKKLFLTLAVLFSVNAYALDVPKPSALDARVKTVTFHPENVVKVQSYVGIATSIIFDKDESVIEYMCGFADGWEFKTNDNYFFLKALSPDSTTNLLIRTNKHFYTFQLEFREPADGVLRFTNDIAFVIKFLYPDDDAKRERFMREKAEIAKIKNTPPDPRNWNYTMSVGKNSQIIAPSAAWDDGRFTYLKFPNNKAFPVVYMRDYAGEESILNWHIAPEDKDVLVIHKINPEFTLRMGDSVVAVFNEAYDPNGISTKSGTTVQGLERRVRGDDK